MDYNSHNLDGGYVDQAAARKASVAAMTQNVTGEIKNPLVGMSKADLMADVESFAKRHDLMDKIEVLKKGAMVAQNPTNFENMEELDDEDRQCLREEVTRRWHHPFPLYVARSYAHSFPEEKLIKCQIPNHRP